MVRLVPLALAVSLLAGCVSLPSSGDKNYSSSKVGDRASYDFNEVVVMAPCAKAQEGFLNLHVQLSATINPQKVTIAGNSEVQEIVSRLYPRLAAAVTAVIQPQADPLSDLDALREKVAQEADRVFNAEFRKWAFSEDYEVQLVVISMHFTNGSVPCKSESVWRYY